MIYASRKSLNWSIRYCGSSASFDENRKSMMFTFKSILPPSEIFNPRKTEAVTKASSSTYHTSVLLAHDPYFHLRPMPILISCRESMATTKERIFSVIYVAWGSGFNRFPVMSHRGPCPYTPLIFLVMKSTCVVFINLKLASTSN